MLFARHSLSWIWGWLVYVLPAISNLILVLLGVVLSLPAFAERVEKTARLKKNLGAICLVAGLVGFGFDVGQRRSSDIEMRQLISRTTQLVTKQDELLGSTKTLVDNTSQISTLMPQIYSLNTQVAALNIKIDGVKGNPQLVSELQAQAETLKKKAELLSLRQQLLSAANDVQSAWNAWSAFQQEMSQGVIHTHGFGEIVFLNVKKSIQQAQRIRDLALQNIPRTDQDANEDQILSSSDPDQARDVVAYLQSLAARVPLPAPQISN